MILFPRARVPLLMKSFSFRSPPARPGSVLVFVGVVGAMLWSGLWSAARVRAQPAPADGSASRPVEAQPLLAQIRRLEDALRLAGSPLSAETLGAIAAARDLGDDARTVEAVEAALAPLVVATVRIDADLGAHVSRGEISPELIEQGWRTFLVRVINEPGVELLLHASSPNARDLPGAPASEVNARWMDFAMLTSRPLSPTLSGLGIEYRPVQIYARDAGTHRARLDFVVGKAEVERVDGRVAKTAGGVIGLWRFDRDAQGWAAIHATDVGAKDGVLRVDCTGGDPYFGRAIKAPAGPMVLSFAGRGSGVREGQVFWWTEDAPRPDGGRRRPWSMEGPEADWREYSVEFEAKSDLRGVRIDPLAGEGWAEFDWIALSYSGGLTPESLAGRGGVDVDFRVVPSTSVTFRVHDEHGEPTIASFVVEDGKGRVYPTPSKRLAPDFFFQPQVYRGDGETLRLPAGPYRVRASRGPESIPETRELIVGSDPVTFEYRVKRWVDPALRGWFSGDHHIHAAGCRHYESPTEGVLPADMARHIVGEDLKVGAALTWGPCFDFQKQFFSAQVDAVSTYPYLLRYDIEVSGFGSHQSGHLCLLRLREQIPPGGESKDHWPTLGLNTLRWAKSQGAICGPAHSGSGIQFGSVGRVDGIDGPGGLPSYDIPRYDGIGANEFIVDITHRVPGPDGDLVPAVDFISTMDTDRRAELNMWYHTLNVGYRVRASGETDFPCISGDRVGMGRVYVRMDGRLDYDRWCEGIAAGRSYVSDGSAHLMGFHARSGREADAKRVDVGVRGSEWRSDGPVRIEFGVDAAVRRDGPEPVTIELIVNGFPWASTTVETSGVLDEVSLVANIRESSWVAYRVFPHAHTNPIFVIVGDRPIRASRASAEWCRRGVDQCWREKARFYAPDELDAAREAYDHARREFERRIRESREGS